MACNAFRDFLKSELARKHVAHLLCHEIEPGTLSPKRNGLVAYRSRVLPEPQALKQGC